MLKLLLRKFLAAISKFLPPPEVSPFRLEAVSGIDPKHIYVENVRSVLGVSSPEARVICERAVQEGLFSKQVEVRCPDGEVAAIAQIEQQLPSTVYCWSNQGHIHEYEVDTSTLEKKTFYVLNG